MKQSFEIDYSDLMEKLDSIESGLDGFFRNYIKKLLSKLLKTVKKLTPVKTGHLRRSWKTNVISSNEGELYNDVKYAVPVELGHRTKGGGFVAGRFMLTRTLEGLEEQIKHDLNEEIQSYINSKGAN